MALEIVTPSDASPALTQEIVCFLDSQQTGHPFQFPQWSDASSRFAVFRQDDRICWFAHCGIQSLLSSRLPILRGMTVNRGPVCDDDDRWRDGSNQFAREILGERFVYLDVAPDRLQSSSSESAPGFESAWTPLGRPRMSLRLNVTKAEDELLAGMRKNTRYDIRKAERAGISAEPSKEPSDGEDFLRLYLRLAQRKEFPPDRKDSVRNVIRWLRNEPTRGALLLARNGPVVVGGAVIVRSGKRCWYVWGASEKNDRFSAGHLLQWRAILWAKSQGCSEYDFGGYTPNATSGPAWFKAGFGGETVGFVRTHRRVLRSSCYRLMQRLSIVQM